MTEPFEDRLRTHFAERAARISAEPDPGGIIQRSAGRRSPRRVIAGAGVAAAFFAGVGIAAGMGLAGGSTAAPTGSRAASVGGSSAAPAQRAPVEVGPGTPSIAGQVAFTPLSTRTTSASIVIRTYTVGTATGPACSATSPCPPSGEVPGPTPCPRGAMCAEPIVGPNQPVPSPTAPPSGTAPGSGTAPRSGSGTAQGSGAATGGSGSDPTAVGGCGQLVIELSTDRAVAVGTAPWPTTPPPAPDTLAVLGTGTFGSSEGGPVSWVAVWAGSEVASVHLSSGASVLDASAPTLGIAVLAAPGGTALSGADVVAVDKGGATVASMPADQVSGGSVCAKPVPTTTTTTTTTTPPGPATTTTIAPAPTPDTRVVPPSGVATALPPRTTP